jgi:hypothetical protein
MKLNYLKLSWSVSRGRDTYGYNICRLDSRSGHRYRCSGGGYDMVGKVFGDWLQSEHQTELRELVADLPKVPYGSTTWLQIAEDVNPSFYGLTIRPDDGLVILDGACGIESMRRIARALGLSVSSDCNKKGNAVGYFISVEEKATA